jgi:hypothetical protein
LAIALIKVLFPEPVAPTIMMVFSCKSFLFSPEMDMYTGNRDILNQKGPTKAESQNEYFIFHPILMQFLPLFL